MEIAKTTSGYATLTRRFVALFIDGLILSIACIFGDPLSQIMGGVAIWILYASFLESSDLKATLGKYVMGIQVVDSQGRKISFRTSVVRTLLKEISGIFVIGFLFALFNDKKQTLHDLLTDTVVIKGKSELPIGKTWLQSIRQTLGFDSSRSSESDVLSQLERIQALRDKGVLTEEEFQVQKKKILQDGA